MACLTYNCCQVTKPALWRSQVPSLWLQVPHEGAVVGKLPAPARAGQSNTGCPLECKAKCLPLHLMQLLRGVCSPLERE
jgi:hypothetical protein